MCTFSRLGNTSLSSILPTILPKRCSLTFTTAPSPRNAFVVVLSQQESGRKPELEQLVRLVRTRVCCVGKCAHKAAHKVPRKSFAGTAKNPTYKQETQTERDRERKMEEWILKHSVPHIQHTIRFTHVMFVSIGNY